MNQQPRPHNSKQPHPQSKQTMFNKSQPMQSYIQYLQDTHNIHISYGDIFNIYKLLPVFTQLANRRQIEDYDYYVYYFGLPDNEFLDDVKLCYSTLFCKYFITSYDKDKQLQILEFLNIDTVEELIEMLSEEIKNEN